MLLFLYVRVHRRIFALILGPGTHQLIVKLCIVLRARSST